MGRVAVPISDYVGDTKGALDNSVRVLQAITDLAADAGWLGTTLSTMHLIQGLMQVRNSLFSICAANSPTSMGHLLLMHKRRAGAQSVYTMRATRTYFLCLP